MGTLRAVLFVLLAYVGAADANVPEGAVVRCSSSSNLNNAATFQAGPDRLYALVFGNTAQSPVVAYSQSSVARVLPCHPGGSGWTQTISPAYASGQVGQFTAFEIGFLQELSGVSPWGVSAAVQRMGWFLAPSLFGLGFLVGVRS